MLKNIIRCLWCGNDALYMKYHDDEWGKTVTDDRILFEFLILESAQAGLSWITVLKRREGYRKLFAQFDVQQVANYTAQDIDRIAKDPSIIRHKGKINAAVNNAKIFVQIQAEYGSFYNYLYSFMPNREPIINSLPLLKKVQVTSIESDVISKDLKKKGVTFFGSTICYAYMQAVGMVNDHIDTCSFK